MFLVFGRLTHVRLFWRFIRSTIVRRSPRALVQGVCLGCRFWKLGKRGFFTSFGHWSIHRKTCTFGSQNGRSLGLDIDMGRDSLSVSLPWVCTVSVWSRQSLEDTEGRRESILQVRALHCTAISIRGMAFILRLLWQ